MKSHKFRSIPAIFFIISILISSGATASDFEVSPFSAHYYLENDGRTPGEGNDGSDLNIVPQLIATEVTPFASIIYPWDYLYDIDAHNFYAVWEGEIEVFSPITTINVNFDVSWSNVKFYVNDELLGDWANYDKDLPLTLSKGMHHIRIEHHNHWHTAGFNASFTSYPQISTSAAVEFGDIQMSMDEDTKIVYISGYESNGLYNNSTITLPEYEGSLILFLGSYRAINWIVNNPHNTDVAAVVFNSYSPGSSINNLTESPIYHITDFPTSYGFSGSSSIEALTGSTADYIYSAYGLSDIVVPAFD